MKRTEACDAWMKKLNEPASRNCYLNCAEDKDRGLYWIQYESGERFEFSYDSYTNFTCARCKKTFTTSRKTATLCLDCADYVGSAIYRGTLNLGVEK